MIRATSLLGGTAVTDSSVHSCRDTLVTAMFNPQDDVAAWATCQQIWPAKIVAPGDFDVEEDVERDLARCVKRWHWSLNHLPLGTHGKSLNASHHEEVR